jgi:hypothetical protein
MRADADEQADLVQGLGEVARAMLPRWLLQPFEHAEPRRVGMRHEQGSKPQLSHCGRDFCFDLREQLLFAQRQALAGEIQDDALVRDEVVMRIEPAPCSEHELIGAHETCRLLAQVLGEPGPRPFGQLVEAEQIRREHLVLVKRALAPI